MENTPRDFFPSMNPRPPGHVRKMLAVAHACTKIFINDTVQFVKENIAQDISRHNTTVNSDDSQIIKERWKSLEKWSACKQPLEIDLTVTRNLLRAMHHRSGDMSINKFNGHITHQALTTIFYNVALGGVTKYPLIKKSPFVKILPEALKLIRASCMEGDNEEKVKSNFNTWFSLSLRELCVHHIPAMKANTGGKTMDYLVWQNLMGPSDNPDEIITRLDISDPFRELAHNMIASSAATGWSTTDLELKDLPRFAEKTTKPDNWRKDIVQLQSTKPDAAYVKEAYNHVSAMLDMNKPVHKLIIFISIVVSKMSSVLRHSSAVPDEFYGLVKAKNTSESDLATKYCRLTHWDPTENKKGHKHGDVFLVMFSVFALALLDQTSPLNQHLKTHNGSLGTPWTSKHGWPHSYHLSSDSYSYLTLVSFI